MPNVEVRCSVSNCFFHKEGNFCGAETIKIDTDSNKRKKENTEFASDFDFAKDKAATSKETCCKTFKPKKLKKK